MKKVYARLWLKKFIKYNQDNPDKKDFNHKLNRSIIHLSHRVHKGRGIHGHNSRQDIRKQLRNYSKMEIRRYQPSMIDRIWNYLKRLFG